MPSILSRFVPSNNLRFLKIYDLITVSDVFDIFEPIKLACDRQWIYLFFLDSDGKQLKVAAYFHSLPHDVNGIHFMDLSLIFSRKTTS